MKTKLLAIIMSVVLVVTCISGLYAFAAPDGGLIINQVYGGGTADSTPFDHSFIELYNNSDAAINLAGYSVGYSSNGKTGTGAEVKLILTGNVPAHTSYLISCGAELSTSDEYLVGTVTDPDITWDQAIDNKQYCIKLYDADGKQIDGAAGKDKKKTEEDLAEGETFASTSLSKQKSIRRINFADTDDNEADFETVKYEKAELNYYFDIDKYVAAYGPRSTKSGAWTETSAVSENFVGYNFAEKEEVDGFGPYGTEGAVTLTDKGLAVEFSSDVYATHELNPQEVAVAQYAVVVAKSSAPDKTAGFALTIGDVGQAWDAWTDLDGNTIENLTDEFKAYYIDLETSGVTTPVVADSADFAINQGTAAEGTVTIAAVQFLNSKSRAEEHAQKILAKLNSSTSGDASTSGDPEPAKPADLVIGEIDCSPNVLLVDGEKQISAKIRNLGETDVAEGVSVEFYIDSIPAGTVTVNKAIAAGDETVVVCNIDKKIYAGTHTVTVGVNRLKAVEESNYANNYLRQKMAVLVELPTGPSTSGDAEEETTKPETTEPAKSEDRIKR